MRGAAKGAVNNQSGGTQLCTEQDLEVEEQQRGRPFGVRALAFQRHGGTELSRGNSPLRSRKPLNERFVLGVVVGWNRPTARRAGGNRREAEKARGRNVAERWLSPCRGRRGVIPREGERARQVSPRRKVEGGRSSEGTLKERIDEEFEAGRTRSGDGLR
jgi:hypothetical protein